MARFNPMSYFYSVMQNTPFTLAQAADICEDFEDLIGTSPDIGGIKNVVEAVIFCPFEEGLKLEFIRNYTLSGGDGEKALAGYDADDYDVIILFRTSEDSVSPLFYSIRDYIDQIGLKYNYPE